MITYFPFMPSLSKRSELFFNSLTRIANERWHLPFERFARAEVMANPSVIIVGAGLAGLAAARVLERRGCALTVLAAK